MHTGAPGREGVQDGVTAPASRTTTQELNWTVFVVSRQNLSFRLLIYYSITTYSPLELKLGVATLSQTAWAPVYMFQLDVDLRRLPSRCIVSLFSAPEQVTLCSSCWLFVLCWCESAGCSLSCIMGWVMLKICHAMDNVPRLLNYQCVNPTLLYLHKV